MNYTGTWYNELGSKMTLSGSGSLITGTYQSGVGASGTTYGLSGRINPSPHSGMSSQAIAWSVAWNNPYSNFHSATAWSGQYQKSDQTKQEQIVTLWYLARETSSGNDWESTLAGKDVFTRNNPSDEEIKKARQSIAPSHPVD